jgi:uncharacterized membrane protein (UPF0182 family)
VIHPEHSGNESVHTAQGGITQIVRNMFGGGEKSQDRLFAFSVLVNILLGVLLYGAWKDLQTQIWLRSDSLTKENAALLAEIKSTEALVQAYGIAKTVQTQQEQKK